MDEQKEFSFCPKCGAVMQNGVCQSCGYGSWTKSTVSGDVVIHSKPKSGPNKHGVLVGVGVTVGIAFLVVFIIFTVLCVVSFFQRIQVRNMPGYGNDTYDDGYFGYGDPYDFFDDYYDNYDDDYEEYVPDKSDDYYEEITDATSLGLSYGILWQSVSLHPADTEDTCAYDCFYPILKGEDKEKFASMNQKIEVAACKYKASYEEYAMGASSYGYVTYMDEEKISLAFKHSLYEKNSTHPRVEAITFRLDTGEVISHDEMKPVDLELVWQFRARNTYQNGTVDFVDDLSDEELEAYLKSDADSVMFYTPVGLEIGFNYDEGWVTVTLKDEGL